VGQASPDIMNAFTVENVALSRRGYRIEGKLVVLDHHMVFQFENEDPQKSPREIWICYPMIESISKSRGSSWMANNTNEGKELPSGQDHYASSHIHLLCKDFTYYWFDFVNDEICSDIFAKLSENMAQEASKFYAYDYKRNALEEKLDENGWSLYDENSEYLRQGLKSGHWRATEINNDYKFCPSYPRVLIVPASISDNVVNHAGKFRSKQRIPAVVYRHRGNSNHNVIARCAQPLVGINIQNRSLQDEKLISEIFKSQERERTSTLASKDELQDQPQRNLIVDLRPISNAMAQHALGAGTENIDKYRESLAKTEVDSKTSFRPLDKIFGNIDNIHAIRDSLTKLTNILRDLDKRSTAPSTSDFSRAAHLQQQLTKTLWLNRIAIILQSVDRITKSIHLNNTNVIIHCSDGWDRTSQVSALLQLCLDPYFRTLSGFMILIEKEWVSFGYKFKTRADHGRCIGAIIPANDEKAYNGNVPGESGPGTQARVASFFQKAAHHIKTSAAAAAAAASSPSNSTADLNQLPEPMVNTYSGSSERSPVFHQFLDCVYQIYRQCPTAFEFNSRFLKRLFYHHYSCQYGTFLANTEQEYMKTKELTVSAWDYFRSRPNEFVNRQYDADTSDVLFFNYSDVKWWYELYGRSDEEMNGLSNSLDRKFKQMKLQK
jgi:hypothetical protein